jgi:hypothetical protein
MGVVVHGCAHTLTFFFFRTDGFGFIEEVCSGVSSINEKTEGFEGN